MGISLSLATKQTLNLSPLMLQRLELMALPLTELQAKIKEAVESNPALEIPTSTTNSWENITENIPKKTKGDDYSDSSAYGSDTSFFYDTEASDRQQKFMENALSTSETLMEHLNQSLRLEILNDNEREIGELLISNLDKNGFNRIDPLLLIEGEDNNILPHLKKDEKIKIIKKMVKMIQRFEPFGCCCNSWQESLYEQAIIGGLEEELQEAFKTLVFKELEKIRANKYKSVCKSLDIDEETLEDLVQFLKTLNPFPGAQYDSGPNDFVIPDLSIHVVKGKIELKTSAANLPDLTISDDFVDLASDIKDKETKKYIKEQVQLAKELINQIDMRNKNIFKLGTILIEKQSDFFFKGPLYIKPLTQKETAVEMNVHETTVSRLANSKWIETDWGIIPIKKLFSSAMESNKGSTSKTAIKEMIKIILEEHDGPKALSDQKIANKLNEKGITIARRTVTKYRKELNIDSTYIRGN